MLLLNVQHPFDTVDGVAGAQVPVELPVVAGEETVDAGKAPAGPAGPMPHKGGAGVSDYGAVFGVGSIFLVTKYGIAIADAVYEIQHGPYRGIPNEIFSTQAGPDHRLGIGDGLSGDSLNLGQGVRD